MASTVCEEVFDEISYPSEEEVREYATKIGIDPDSEPQLIPLAVEGLMKALPLDWKPCYDDKSKSYYYYNTLAKKSQWEHPLDDVYRGLVRKVRAESQSLSLQENRDDATCNDIPSFQETTLNTKERRGSSNTSSDDNSKSYNYNKNVAEKSQGNNRDDATCNDIPSLDKTKLNLKEIKDFSDASSKQARQLALYNCEMNIVDPSCVFRDRSLIGNKDDARCKEVKLSPLKISPSASPKRELKLFKQRSEDFAIGTKKLSLGFCSLDEDKDGNFDKHPRTLDKPELKLSGGGAMFLKSNTKKSEDVSVESGSAVQAGRHDSLQDSLHPKGILRETYTIEHSKSLDFDKLSPFDKIEKDDEDKKSVRFHLDNNTDIGITFSDKSFSEEELMVGDKKFDELFNVKATPTKSRFTVLPVEEAVNSPCIVRKPNQDVILSLAIYESPDSEEYSNSLENAPIPESFDTDNSFSEKRKINYARKLEHIAKKKIMASHQNVGEEENEELQRFHTNLQKAELKSIVEDEKERLDEEIKTELTKIRNELHVSKQNTIKEFQMKLKEKLQKLTDELEENFKEEEKKLKEQHDSKREELEKYYEGKFVETEKDLAEKVDKTKEELVFNHNSSIEQLKQNHAILIEDLKREFKIEEQVLKKEHQSQMAQQKAKMQSELEMEKNKSYYDERAYEKLRCEKRLLEDKYKCLKEKYFRLKSDVKLSIEKRNRRKEQSTATNTTGSETEQSHSNRDRMAVTSSNSKILEKPPTPKHSRSGNEETRVQGDIKNIKTVLIQDFDTSVSDNCYQSDEKTNQNESEDSMNPGKSKKKIFSRCKSSSTPRINSNSKSRKPQGPCSPVENLRRQLQKLEDLEDQFPENPQSDTYHLRYPFSDSQKLHGSSELEFFRHRIHVERDSIKRAKESLRSQNSLFQERQKELKLKHGTMARHTLQQLCQEEKELADMEVNLHRTRSLLGEKVIRLRHLEQSLQRADIQNDQKLEEPSLSDISSHSASSGISSTEFAFGENFIRVLSSEKFQESSKIFQSLENLNYKIREIWDVLRSQHQQTNIAQVIPPLTYPDLGWPILAGSESSMPAPPSIPTLDDRLHNYRQHVMLANAQSTVVTHAANQRATTTLVERTSDLRRWFRQTGAESNQASNTQTTL